MHLAGHMRPAGHVFETLYLIFALNLTSIFSIVYDLKKAAIVSAESINPYKCQHADVDKWEAEFSTLGQTIYDRNCEKT